MFSVKGSRKICLELLCSDKNRFRNIYVLDVRIKSPIKLINDSKSLVELKLGTKIDSIERKTQQI